VPCTGFGAVTGRVSFRTAVGTRFGMITSWPERLPGFVRAAGRIMVTLLSYDLALVADGAGRLRLFALGRDGVLYHLTQLHPNNGWSGWTNLGTPGQPWRIRPLRRRVG
jgi:hypothetical protein